MKALLPLCLAALLGAGPIAAAEAKELQPVQQWQGSVDAGAPPAGQPEVITTAADFAALWKQCARAEPAPEIDWTKRFAFFAATSGSILRVNPVLEAEGQVKAASLATMDFRPGFRYVLLVLPRAGVATVNGRKLP